MQEQEDTVTPVLKQQLQQCETEIRNVMKAIRQGILTDSTRAVSYTHLTLPTSKHV